MSPLIFFYRACSSEHPRFLKQYWFTVLSLHNRSLLEFTLLFIYTWGFKGIIDILHERKYEVPLNISIQYMNFSSTSLFPYIICTNISVSLIFWEYISLKINLLLDINSLLLNTQKIYYTQHSSYYVIS